MTTTYTVTAVTDWRVTILEDRGDGHTTTWELPPAWVDGPVVGEPVRGLVFGATIASIASMRAAGVELAHAADQFLNNAPEGTPGAARLQSAIEAGFAVFGMRAPAPAAPVAQPLTDEQIAEAVREAGLDWHNGWSLDETEPNRFVAFARAIEHAHGIGREGGAA